MTYPIHTRVQHARRWRAQAATLATAPFLALANYTLPLGFPHDIGFGAAPDAATRSWLLSGAAIGITVTLIPTGQLADRVGPRRVLQFGSAALVCTLLLSSASPSAPTLVAARVLAGLASGAVLSASLGCVPQIAATRTQLGTATRLWGAMIGAGIAVGPLFALVADGPGAWRVGFGFLAGGQLLLLLTTGMTIPSAGPSTRGPSRLEFDLVGAILLALALGTGLYGLMSLRQSSPAIAVFAIAVGLLLLVALVALELRRERRGLSVVFPVSRLRQPAFLLPTAQSAILGFSLVSFMNYFSVWAAQSGSFDPAVVAAAVLVSAGTSVFASLIAPRWVSRTWYDVRVDWVVGFGLCAIGIATFVLTDPTITTILSAFFASGAGLGILNAALARDSLRAVPVADAGLGAGVNNASRYLGNAIGTAALTATGAGLTISTPAMVAGGAALLGALLSWPGGRTTTSS